MNLISPALHSSHAGKPGVWLLLRWILVLVIALDLVSSPWHAHHHEGAAEDYASHAEAAVVTDSADFATDADDASHDVHGHVASAHGGQRGHSLAALRVTPLQLAAPAALLLWAIAPVFKSLTDLLAPPAVDRILPWRPRHERVPVASFRALPPDGRAPPFLHV